MRLAEGIDKRVWISDIETLLECIDIGGWDPDKKIWHEFEISRYRNDLVKFVKFYTSHQYDFFCGFNSIDFDQNILQFIVEHADSWYNLSGLEIAKTVYQFVQMHLDNSKYNIPPQYKENSFPIFPLDLFKIHHFDNDAKRTSLKWCAFMMNMDVEEMPIDHGKKNLTQEEIETVKEYRRNDVRVTEALLQLTMGNTDLPELIIYKGKNKLQDRFDVMKETGMNCLNWSDVKIGEEWNKSDYMKAERIGDEKDVYPKEIKYPFGKKFSKYFPKTLEFTTKHMQDFQKELGNEYVKNVLQKFPVVIGSSKYTIAKGGVHTNEKHRAIIPIDGWVLQDGDVGSQYPNSIVKMKISPPHLKSTILQQYESKIQRRITYKGKASALKKEEKKDEARPFDSIQEMLKLALNGGYFGKLNQPGSFLQYPEGYLKVCMGNQMEILMLVEMLEEAGIQVISGNTDGIVSYYPKEKQEIYNRICKEWEIKVGNDVMGKLEFSEFTGLWQENINHYIARKADGTAKRKGRFATDFELHRNKSNRIIALALEAYFIEGKDPIEFIKNHENIFDFCGIKRTFGRMYFEEQWEEKGKIKTKAHHKMVVYYMSTKGTILYKRGLDKNNDVVNDHCAAPTDLGQPRVVYFNKAFTRKTFKEYYVDYNYYILEALERIDALEKTKKAKSFLEGLSKTAQGSLF